VKTTLKYSWLTYRRDQLWFPLAFLALFIVILLIMRHPGVRFSIARAYLGFIVPLVGGILAAYSVLDDPALELRFSTPVRAEQTLFARLGLILAVQAACALVFQLFLGVLGVDLSPLGSLAPHLSGVVAIGAAAGQVRSVFEGRVAVRDAASIEEATRTAFEMAPSGGTVLLAPACASWDMFADYAERGERFAAAARALEKEGART